MDISDASVWEIKGHLMVGDSWGMYFLTHVGRKEHSTLGRNTFASICRLVNSKLSSVSVSSSSIPVPWASSKQLCDVWAKSMGCGPCYYSSFRKDGEPTQYIGGPRVIHPYFRAVYPGL